MTVTHGNSGVGVALRALRKAAGMTIAEVSAAAGISGPYLSNVENGNAEPSATWVHMVMGQIGRQMLDAA